MGNTGMYVLRAAVFLIGTLIGCHSSAPSVSRGSGTAETGAPVAPAAGSAAPQQNEAASPGAHPPEPTSETATVGPASGATAAAPGSAAGSAGKSPRSPKSPPLQPSTSAEQVTLPVGGGSAGAPGIGDSCGPDDRCAAGLNCVAYYGFAGPRGPQFKTCEIRCKDSSVCPKDRTCVTVSDGPGRVCR